VDGQLARQRLANWHRRPQPRYQSSAKGVRLEFEFTSAEPVEVLVTARFDLPQEVLQPYSEDWPANAQPAFLGPRALKSWRLKLGKEPSATAP
jgi:hypothetical protein